MKSIGDIECIRLSVFEDYPMKIKDIEIKLGKETVFIKKEAEIKNILKCGDICSIILCKDDKFFDNFKKEED